MQLLTVTRTWPGAGVVGVVVVPALALDVPAMAFTAFSIPIRTEPAAGGFPQWSLERWKFSALKIREF